ncbi:MAG: hypothetical protein LBE67_02560 [Kocuria palustris]|nr:hypothetical protein [Kocuria palustris]
MTLLPAARARHRRRSEVRSIPAMAAVMTRIRRTPRNGSIDSSGLRLIDRRPGLGAHDLPELPAQAATVLSQKRWIRVMMIVTFWMARWHVPTAPPWAMSLRPRQTFSVPVPSVDRHLSA